MKVLNLGCGHKFSAHPDVINIDWSIYLRMRSSRLLFALAPFLLSGARRERFERLPRNIMSHDLSRGIPFPDGSVDVIFHSNVLEHLDREIAEHFLGEARRALKPGGVHRIVVPDFEYACGAYMAHIAKCDRDPQAHARHDDFIALVLEQSIRREAAGTRLQPPLRRFIENAVLGDARRRGETHQWMYDRISLASLLKRVGYRDVELMRYDTSAISGWAEYGLDTHADGSEYAPGSLYMEAVK
jgi:SAM-dependent methyltransferase